MKVGIKLPLSCDISKQDKFTPLRLQIDKDEFELETNFKGLNDSQIVGCDYLFV